MDSCLSLSGLLIWGDRARLVQLIRSPWGLHVGPGIFKSSSVGESRQVILTVRIIPYSHPLVLMESFEIITPNIGSGLLSLQNLGS